MASSSDRGSSRRSVWYADTQIIPNESTATSLALYKTLLSNPATDVNTRKACYTKLVALLDSLPAVRSFNSQSKNISQSLCDLLVYRCDVHRELAQLYRESGNIHNACHFYDRATRLFETLISFITNCSDDRYESARSVSDSLELTLRQWIDVEQAMGRKTKADKLGLRLERWQSMRSASTM